MKISEAQMSEVIVSVCVPRCKFYVAMWDSESDVNFYVRTIGDLTASICVRACPFVRMSAYMSIRGYQSQHINICNDRKMP